MGRPVSGVGGARPRLDGAMIWRNGGRCRVRRTSPGNGLCAGTLCDVSRRG